MNFYMIDEDDNHKDICGYQVQFICTKYFQFFISRN